MIKIFTFIALLVFGGISLLDTDPVVSKNAPITVCGTGGGMSQWASDPAFIAAHLPPKVINFIAEGKMIQFDTPDGKTANGYYLKAKKKSDKWLFVYQEWWGLNDNIKNQAQIFYKDLGENVNVLALDMYDGKSTSDPQEAGQLMRGASQVRLESIVKGGMAFAGEDARIANVGWCFGGGWSLKSGLLGSSQNVGVVMYYGMPVDDVELLKTLNSDVLGLFATENWISKDVIETFAENMETAGKKLDYKIYDAVHGFANPSNPKHDEAAARDAYSKALNYLKSRLDV